jgi:hypothetical protein
VRQRGFIQLSPLVYLALAVLVLGLLAKIGHSIYETIEESVWSEVRKEKAEETKRAALKANDAAKVLEKGNAKAKIVYRTITKSVDKYIDRPVYRNVCFDDDGLRDANQALSGQIAPRSQPDKPLPKPGTSG